MPDLEPGQNGRRHADTEPTGRFRDELGRLGEAMDDVEPDLVLDSEKALPERLLDAFGRCRQPTLELALVEPAGRLAAREHERVGGRRLEVECETTRHERPVEQAQGVHDALLGLHSSE